MAYIGKFRNKWRAQVQVNGKRVSSVFDTEDAAKKWAGWQTDLLKANRSPKSMLEKLAYADTALLTSIPTRVLKAIHSVPHSLSDILDAAIPLGTQVGIYFLIKDEEVVYVGQSIEIFRRIGKHRNEGKDFDSFAFIECEKSELDKLEAKYITALAPELNWTFGNPSALSR